MSFTIAFMGSKSDIIAPLRRRQKKNAKRCYGNSNVITVCQSQLTALLGATHNSTQFVENVLRSTDIWITSEVPSNAS